MKYVILIHGNPASRAAWEGFSDAQRSEGLRLYAALHEDLVASGEYIVSEALADPSLGRRPPARDEPAASADGPFAEAKEHLAGFFLVECDGFDRALEIAGRVPESAYGLVEVRPVLTYGGAEM